MKKEIKGIYKCNGGEKDLYVIAYDDGKEINFEFCDDIEKAMDYAVDYCNSKGYKRDSLREALKNDPCFNLTGTKLESLPKQLFENYKDEEKSTIIINLIEENDKYIGKSRDEKYKDDLKKVLNSITDYNAKNAIKPFLKPQDGMIDDEEELAKESPEIVSNASENGDAEDLDQYQQNLEANLDDYIIEGTASDVEQDHSQNNGEEENPPANSDDDEDLDNEDEEENKFAFFKDKMSKFGNFFKTHKKKFIVAGVAVIVGIVGINVGKGLFKLNRDNTPTRTTTREFTLNDDKDNDLDNNNNKENDNNTNEQENAVQGNEIKEETKKENTPATSNNTATTGSATTSNNSTGTTVAGSSYDNGNSNTNTNSSTDTSTSVSGSDTTSNSSENTSGSETQPQEDNTQNLPEGNGDFQDPNVTIDDVKEPTLPTDNEQTISEDNTYTEEETYQEENTNTTETPSQEIEVEAPVVEDETTPPTEEVEEDINLDDVELNDKFENIEDIENAIGDDITIGDNEVTLTEDQEMTTPDENAAALGYDDVYTEEVPVEQPESPSQEIEVEAEAEQSVAPTEEVSEPVVEEQTIEEVPVEQTSPASEEITVEAPEVEVTAPVETEVQSSTPEEASYEEEVPVYQNDQVADAIVNAMENGENITYNPETGEISSQPTYDVNETSLTK